jgi:hypothetical protein
MPWAKANQAAATATASSLQPVIQVSSAAAVQVFVLPQFGKGFRMAARFITCIAVGSELWFEKREFDAF